MATKEGKRVIVVNGYYATHYDFEKAITDLLREGWHLSPMDEAVTA